MAVKTYLRECCLSSIRHITANVAIKVEIHTHTKTHREKERERDMHTSPGEALGRIHLLAVSLREEGGGGARRKAKRGT